MSPKIPLPPIGGGLDESRAPGEQPIGTYLLGRNVRGVDPLTGRRVWGAQRAGLEAIGSTLPGGAHARHFAVASKLVAAREFRALDIEPLDGAVPAAVGAAWTTRLNERVLDVDEGIDGQGYFLLDSGDVAILNKRGKETGRIYSESPRGFTTVPRVFSAEDGAVYTAATRDEPLAGVGGYVYRWVKQPDKTYTLAWQAEFPTRIATFVVGPGLVYVAEDGVPDENGVVPEAALSRIGNPLLGPQIAWRETVFPRPCFGLALTPNGQCLVSAPSNPLRVGGADGVLFTERNVGWTPFELDNFDIGNVWAWIDAGAANEEGQPPADGEEVFRLRDRRHEENDFAVLDDDIPVRELTRSPSGIFTPPTWSAEAFGGAGGVKFSGYSALISQANASLTDIAQQRALIPGTFPTWTLVALVEFTESQENQAALRQILGQRTTTSGQPDWRLTATGLDVEIRDGAISSQNLTTATTARTALLTLQFGGDGTAISCRVNGTNIIPNTIFPNIEQGGPYALATTSVTVPGPFTVLGAGRPNRANIARAAGVTYETEEPGNLAPLSVLFNGDRFSSATSATIRLGELTSAGPIGKKLRIDLGTDLNVDTLVLWSSSTARSAATAVIRCGNDLTYALPDLTQTFDVVRGQGDNSATRTEVVIVNPSGGSFQYVEIEAVTYFGSASTWQLSEVELFAQDAGESLTSAEFNLAEMVVMRGADLSGNPSNPRELVEGYIAHHYGVAHTLDAGHPYAGAGNFLGAAGDSVRDQDAALLRAQLNTPFPILAKYGTNGEPLAVYSGAGVGCGAVYAEDHIITIGEAEPGDPSAVPNFGTTMARFRDESKAFVRVAGIEPADADYFEVDREPIALEAGPCSSIFVASDDGMRRVDGRTMEVEWRLPMVSRPFRGVPAGLQFDGTLQGGDCGPEFLYVAQSSILGASRIDTLGLTETGREAGRDTELLVVSSAGDVLRRVGDDWETVEAGALLGQRPASATLSGRTFFADGLGYRVYDHQLRQLRDFEEAVSGEFPPRCRYIAAYRGRLVLAGGDNAFTIFQSRFGDPFDFEFGVEIQSIAQAVAGTTSSQGSVPEPITALMPWRNEVLFVGTTESLWAITGDLADGGRLDHIDKSQGVAPGYAWCESPRGIYYFSGRGGVMLIAGAAPVPISRAIERRLEEVDLAAYRVELTYNWIDKTVHVFVIPKSLGSVTEHFVYCEESGAWFVDDFGDGFERAITGAASLIGDTPEDRTLVLGMADGQVYRWDQYAGTDAGRQVRSSAVVGPLVPSAQATEVRVRGFHAQLSSSQGGVQVATRASESADAMGPPSQFRDVRPGRGFGVPLGASAPAVFIEVRGLGSAWSIHEARVEVERIGEARRMR